MAKINITPEDKAALIEAINNSTEPPTELLPKLFPGTAEKFDLQALDRAKIPILEYAGKRSRAAILAEAGAGIGAAPLQIVRCFGEAKEDEWQNMIVQGDNLQFLKTCYKNVDPLIKDKVKGQVKLIYIDPPFATKSEFAGKNGERSYSDKVATAEFIEGLRERLLYLHELLAENGSIYLHLDQKMSHYAKIIMDEIFGKACFRNEVIWDYSFRMMTLPKFYNRKHDTILFYSKGDNYFKMPKTRWTKEDLMKSRKQAIHVDDEGIEWIWMPGGKGKSKSKMRRVDEILSEGKAISDVWDIPIISSSSKERANYPTQKPEALLERIIDASCKPEDLVIDIFGGSGTTAAVAEKMGRRWIACDFGKHAIYTIQKRIFNIPDSESIGSEDIQAEVRCKKCSSVVKESKHYEQCSECNSFIEKKSRSKKQKYSKKPNKFCVVSSGAYDFAHIMDLRKHKETYIDFVLALFQLTRDEEKTSKYKLANIYAVKDNNPVEVYPVWDDQFLREVKIDEAYLQDIITQSGGKLKGRYYIITPESCTNVGDTTLKNHSGKDIHFHILTFPYKVLEEVSRKLELQEQPSSQDNVNNLITSTAFYFNEDVQLEAVRTKDGLKITKFETKILDQQGSRFESFTGLSMLLVDLDYEANKPFDMDKTVFAKDIAEDGTIKISGLTKSVGLIAIDKHGNESKPFNLK